MDKTLIVIGNQEETNLFVVNKSRSRLLKIENIENPDARKREKDLVSDSRGRVLKGNGSGSRSIGEENRAVSHSLDQYANRILKSVVKNKFQDKKFNVLLVSEPGFLGLLKKHFKTAKIDVSKTISKELNHLDEKSIFLKIKEEIKFIQ